MSIVRLFFLWKQYYGGDISSDKNFTITFTAEVVETNLAIVTASAPAMWPLARKWFPRSFDRMALSQAYRQDELPEITDGDGGRGQAPFKSQNSAGQESWTTTSAGSHRHVPPADVIAVSASDEDLHEMFRLHEGGLVAEVRNDAKPIIILDHYHRHVREEAREHARRDRTQSPEAGEPLDEKGTSRAVEH